MSAAGFASIRRSLILVAAMALAPLHGSAAEAPGPLDWPVPTRTMRPWTRWWWLGSAVDQPNLERLLANYRDAGLGGVEICPIYGAKGYENRFIPYLSPQWMAMLAVATSAAGHLDLGVDMTTGTGWPMGGPWVPPEEASESVSLRRFPIGPDGKNLAFAEILAAGKNGRRDASVDEEAPRSILCLRAVGPDGSQVDLTAGANAQGLGWTAPGSGWSLYALTAQRPVQKVKRAAPGGAGNVVDPFSIGSLDTYLSRFDEAFKGFRAPLPRAQFQDSFEYYGANWTPLLFSEFARRRGYDLREHLAELAGQADPDSASRVREDYRRTIGELHQEFVARWTAWSHAHGSLTREQAHGAPANIEDVYAIADIPETEGSFGGSAEEQVPMLKFASSAAHVTGRTLASSETFTWLGEHFQVPLSKLKGAADTFLLSGINHIFLHGIPYSPADAPWPGWLFYASVNFGPNGGLWHDLPAFNAYITRCQSILQAGKPDNDILLYFPVADFWQRTGSRVPANDPLVLQFTTPGKWMEGSPFHAAAMELWRKGFSYDEVTDALLERARAEAGSESGGPQGGSILIGGNRYRAIVVPACSFMPVETLRHLLELVRNGGTVIFAGGVPTDVPGVAGLEARQAKMRSLAGGIPFGAPEGGVLMAHLGNGRVLSAIASLPPIEPGVARILVAAGIPRETMADDNLRCIRRARETGFDYFIVNMGDRPIDKWVTLSRPGRSAALFDPLVPDHNGIAATRAAKEGIGVFLHMAPCQSYIVRTSEGEAPQAAAWYYLEPAAQPSLVIVGDWSVHFLDGGPALPSDFHGAGLGSWADREDPEAKRFAGTAVYAISFELPQHSGVDHWRLDLGRVAESARVRINGQEAAKLWCAPFSTDVGRFLHPGENRLEVEVTNLAANRVRDLDLRHVDWKRFYEINFVNHAYRPFDASGWPIRDSGLLGPVTLTPLLPEASPFLGK